MPRPKNTAKDITGEQFGQLAILREIGRDAHRNALWECRCSCGRVVVRSRSYLMTMKRRDKPMWCEQCLADNLAPRNPVVRQPAVRRTSVMTSFKRKPKESSRYTLLHDVGKERNQAMKQKRRDMNRAYLDGRSTAAATLRIARIGDDLERTLDAETLHSPKETISQQERDFAELFRRQPRPGR